MQYLKMFALDVNANTVPDIVYLEFHDESFERTLRARAAAFDVRETGKLHWVVAEDINQDGAQTWLDDFLAMRFAQQFLEFQWFSVDRPFDKYLTVLAEDVDSSGSSGVVKLCFFQAGSVPGDRTLARTTVCRLEAKTASVFDEPATITYEASDSQSIVTFARHYLKFNWYPGAQQVPPLLLPGGTNPSNA